MQALQKALTEVEIGARSVEFHGCATAEQVARTLGRRHRVDTECTAKKRGRFFLQLEVV